MRESLDFASCLHVDTADFDVDEDDQNIMLGYAGDETENVTLLTSSMSSRREQQHSTAASKAHSSIITASQSNR